MTASSAVRRSRTHLLFFFFNDTATTEIYTLSLHDALPICCMFDCTGHGVPGAFMTLIALSFLEQAVAPAGIGTGTGAVIDPGALLGQMNRYIKRVLQQRSRDVQPAWGAPAAPADGLPAEKSSSDGLDAALFLQSPCGTQLRFASARLDLLVAPPGAQEAAQVQDLA